MGKNNWKKIHTCVSTQASKPLSMFTIFTLLQLLSGQVNSISNLLVSLIFQKRFLTSLFNGTVPEREREREKEKERE